MCHLSRSRSTHSCCHVASNAFVMRQSSGSPASTCGTLRKPRRTTIASDAAGALIARYARSIAVSCEPTTSTRLPASCAFALYEDEWSTSPAKPASDADGTSGTLCAPEHTATALNRSVASAPAPPPPSGAETVTSYAASPTRSTRTTSCRSGCAA